MKWPTHPSPTNPSSRIHCTGIASGVDISILNGVDDSIRLVLEDAVLFCLFESRNVGEECLQKIHGFATAMGFSSSESFARSNQVITEIFNSSY